MDPLREYHIKVSLSSGINEHKQMVKNTHTNNKEQRKMNKHNLHHYGLKQKERTQRNLSFKNILIFIQLVASYTIYKHIKIVCSVHQTLLNVQVSKRAESLQ